jgi:hypothetical protein
LNVVLYLPNFGQFLAQYNSAALERLCAAGTIERHEVPLEGFVCESFGISRQRDWPVAPLSMLGHGKLPTAEAYLQVNLVHFSLQRDFFELHPVNDLSMDHSIALREKLNQHFLQAGYQFLATNDPHVWMLPIKKSMDVNTCLMSEAWGRDTRAYMPEGDDALALRLLINEAQMLLHEHPVNEAREAAGFLPVNSVWFSGGGVLPEIVAKSKFLFFTDNSLLKGLATLAKARHHAVPEKFSDLPKEQHVLVWLDSQLSKQSSNIEHDWFVPMLKALQMGKLKRLSLRMGVANYTYKVTLKPLDLWKIWRIRKPLLTYFSAISKS